MNVAAFAVCTALAVVFFLMYIAMVIEPIVRHRYDYMTVTKIWMFVVIIALGALTFIDTEIAIGGWFR